MEVLLDRQDLPIARRGICRPSLGYLPDPRIELRRQLGPLPVGPRSQVIDPIQLLRRRDHDPRVDGVLHPCFETTIDERLASRRVPRDVPDRSCDLLRRLGHRERVRALEVAEDPEGLGQGLGPGRRTAAGPWQRRRGRQGHASLGSARIRARPRLAVVPVEREHAPILSVVGIDLEQVHPHARSWVEEDRLTNDGSGDPVGPVFVGAPSGSVSSRRRRHGEAIARQDER